MKEKLTNLVNEPAYWFAVMQILFFGGLFVASYDGANWLKVVICLIWFGTTSFFLASVFNKWWSKYKK